MPRKPETKLMNAIFDPDPWFEDADLHETMEGQTLRDTLNQLIDELTQLKSFPTFTLRIKRIINLRFGFESPDGRGITFEQVSKEFGVTRERIRQIEAKGLRILRHPTRSNSLKRFIKEVDHA